MRCDMIGCLCVSVSIDKGVFELAFAAGAARFSYTPFAYMFNNLHVSPTLVTMLNMGI